ncbi:MAG: family 78 glycoside hydrolase catalytic domain [Bacillota bacterium]
MKAHNLLCEYQKNPLGIDENKPRFSWEVSEVKKGAVQKGYRIIVASSPDLLEQEKGDMWDSGEVKSDKSINITYEGKPLESRGKYYWKVKIWGKEPQAASFSKTNFFEMGLMESENWQAEWITSSEEGPLYRKEFNLEKKIEKARAYVSGLGFYEMQVNGNKAGKEVLDPGQTDYNKTVLYTTKDITSLLQKGKNCVGVMLGNGRYSPEKTRESGAHDTYGNNPVLRLQLEIEFADGTRKIVITDTSWKVSAGPIIYNDLYDGEHYDARLEQEGWSLPGFDDSDWDPTQLADPVPAGEIVSQALFPKIEVCKKIQPEKIISPEPGVFVYDFGQNFTGWVKLKGKGQKGDKVKIKHAEILNEEGMINTTPNRDAEATDVYIFKGEGIEEYHPRFTYHGFRYVEVTGFPEAPSLDNIEGQVVHSKLPVKGKIHCSSDLINQIHKNVLWGQLSNSMSVPTDCPQRDERMGWLGDAQLVVEEAIYNFEMIGFYRKWLRDLRDCQKDDGSVSDVVPPYWPLYPADPAWGTACVTLPWYIYKYYDDTKILTDNYEMIKGYVEFLNREATDYIITDLGKYGDWCPPWHVNSVDTPLELVSTWYYYHDTLVLSKIAKILGKEKEAEKYKKRAEKILEAFNKEFLEEKAYRAKQEKWYHRMASGELSGKEREKRIESAERTFAVESQTSNCLSLYLDMVPEAKKDKVIETLLHDLKVIHDHHFNTGIVGTRYIMDVLTELGEIELAYKLFTQTTYPSLGYMIKEGATTLWERWESLTSAGMNSHNHIMLGSIDSWLYKVLAGIKIDEAKPGFKNIIIKPHFIEKLDYAQGSLNTIRGLITSKWVRDNNKINLEVTIPGNSRAEICLSNNYLGDEFIIKEKNHIIWNGQEFDLEAEGFVEGTVKENEIILAIGSGRYNFSLIK